MKELRGTITTFVVSLSYLLVWSLQSAYIQGTSTADRPPEGPKESRPSHLSLNYVVSGLLKGAVCLDGTPPAYYRRRGYQDDHKKWILHFAGGGWCSDTRSCHSRSRTPLGSSRYLSKNPSKWFGGIHSDNPTTNPHFHGWELAWIVYCDGSSFTGNRDKPLEVGSDRVFLRGRRILEMLLEDLMLKGLSNATHVLLTGSSAGSLTSLLYADYISTRLPNTDVRVLSDAGIFIEPTALGLSDDNHLFRRIVATHNSTLSLNEKCLLDRPQDEGWKCMMPLNFVPYMRTPVFFLNSAYDLWNLIYLLKINCRAPPRLKEMAVNSVARKSNFPKIISRIAPLKNGVDAVKRRRVRDISGFELSPESLYNIIFDSVDADALKRTTSEISKETSTASSSAPSIQRKVSDEKKEKTNGPDENPVSVIAADSLAAGLSKLMSEMNTDKSSPALKEELERLSKIIPLSYFAQPINKVNQLVDRTLSSFSDSALFLDDFLSRPPPSDAPESVAPGPKTTISGNTPAAQDSIMRNYMDGLRLKPPECTEREISVMQTFRMTMVDFILSNHLPAGSGAFLTSCIGHSASLLNESWLGISIQNKSASQAFNEWYIHRPASYQMDIDCAYPCESICPETW